MSVKSAERVLRVFELIAQHPEGLTVKEVSDLLSLPQSSTFNLVGTLHNEGYLNQDSLKKYKLGPKLIQIGTAAMESLDISSEGKPYLKKLMEDVQETVFMALLSDGELVYVVKIDNNRSIRTTAQPGNRKPLYCTGLGKTFLAFLPKDQREQLLEHTELLPITDYTITDKKVLNDNLDSFIQMGYAIDDEENEEGLFCLAAPVFGAKGSIQAAISVAGPKERMLKHKDFIVERLLQTATNISFIAGYEEAKR
ncbi:IclR family transcriptional regulator [Priestia aryabhattai]|uniref:IclR family transcriptional regulator n=1 Tax=Priestia TaxID=2800373 RepID=UPI0003A6260C|nr:MULTISPECIES: IclR family transcriptional regulator [Priestia]MBY0030939.1 IclR family transcriptional regulator [Priestia aryabhattai]MBY0074765.1 IclR family transcriptional regulator [Priestia aryabhattai]